MSAAPPRFTPALWLGAVWLGVLLLPARAQSELIWKLTSAPATNNWQQVAASADGAVLAAVVKGGGIHVSTNGGVTWTLTSAPAATNWQSIACSSNGAVIIAAIFNSTAATGTIYVSTNTGATWQRTSAPGNYWTAVAAAATGTRLVAVASGNSTANSGIYTSTNTGATWQRNAASTGYWQAVATSADGTRQLIAAYNGGIFLLLNSGSVLIQTPAPTNLQSWTSIAVSADGQKVAATYAGLYGGGIYTSANSGTNWTLTAAPNTDWYSVASSADGNRLLAADFAGGIYYSADRGTTWQQTTAPIADWYSVAGSADGEKWAGTGPSVGIYTAQFSPQITTDPQALSVNAGATATFTVTATGTAPLRYQWQWNGTNLTSGGRIAGATSATLTVSNVVAGDAGDYSVIITNAAAAVTSAVAALTVILPPTIITPPASVTKNAGASASFGVGTGGSPALYHWRKNGTNLVNSAVVSGATTPSLGLASLTAASAGNYDVVLANSAGAVTSAVAVLTVISPPVVTNPPAAQTKVVGGKAVFTVGASGSPPLYRWRKGGVNLVRSANIPSVTNATLIVSNLVAGSAGNYDVVLVNAAGTATSAAAALTVVPVVVPVVGITPPNSTNAVRPTATNLLVGQSYQLQTATPLRNWTNSGAAFTATNSAWTANRFWSVAATNQLYFRLLLLP